MTTTLGDAPPETEGILPSQAVRAAIARGWIGAATAVGDDQIQPASLDLRLGATAYRVQASFLPGRSARVADKIDAFTLYALDLGDGAVLERHCVYIVPLVERLALPPNLSGLGNPKSSVGRLDIFVRLLTDYGGEFDRVAAGYHGPLYAEISPRAFAVRVRAGSRLAQLRLRRGRASRPSDTEMRRLNARVPLIQCEGATEPIDRGVVVTVDARGDGPGGLVGYKARRNAGLIDLEKIDHYDPLAYWEPVVAHGRPELILDPFDFYILASRESVTVPSDHAAEMLAYDTLVGEFRVHYAGFFDPGFGMAETGGAGSRAVLEVRAHEVPFVIEDGQVVGRLIYEPMCAVPDKLYGSAIGSSYQRQRLALAKQFRRPGPAPEV